MKNSDSSPDYAVIDVETSRIRDGVLPRTRFWGYADSKGYQRFATTKKLLAFLKRESKKTILHHSNFDVLQLLVDDAPVKILRSHNARLIRCKLFEHTLINSYSVFPLALAKIFAAFGYSKTPLNCKNHEGETEEIEEMQFVCHECNALLNLRNQQDCVDALDCFTKLDELFISLVSVSPLQKGTIAGTAFNAAEICAGGKMPVNTDFLESYRGGRVEVFNVSATVADKFDINSSYPFSFIDCPPKGKLLRLLVDTSDHYCAFFDALSDDCFLFPNGKFETWIYQDNLERYILPHLTKTKIKVRQTETIDFSWLCAVRPLIERLYRLKQESKSTNPALEMVCKLLLNSMYGRMGMKGESERARILDYRPDIRDGTLYKLGRKKWIAFDTFNREVKSNYPFAAYITDNARARLYRAFVGSEAYYGDTDSVITPTGKKYFDRHEKQGSAIGEWKHEGRDKFQARNVKDYTFGDVETLKGGKGFTQWTLKTFAAGNTPHTISRSRITELRKRLILPTGETIPHRI